MYSFEVDAVTRQVILTPVTKKRGTKVVQVIRINEFDKLKRKFIKGTGENYECELVILKTKTHDNNGEDNLGAEVDKAFARRIGYDNWLISFEPNEYDIA